MSEEGGDGEGADSEVRSSYFFPFHSTFSNVTLNPLLRDLTLSILKETLTGGSPINLVEGSDGSCFNIHLGLFDISHEPLSSQHSSCLFQHYVLFGNNPCDTVLSLTSHTNFTTSY